MPEVLLDSDILIDHLRGYEPARQYLERFETGERQGYLSIITQVWLELLGHTDAEHLPLETILGRELAKVTPVQ